MEHLQALEMPVYRSHKRLRALEIVRVRYVQEGVLTEAVDVEFVDERFAPVRVSLKGKPTPMPGWFYIVYEDGYESFSPAAQFLNGNTLESEPVAVFDMRGIGWALKQMHNGERIERDGWNGKGMWIGFIPADQWGLGSGQNVFDYGAAGPGKLLPWIGMRTAQGDFVPWVPSQADILAMDYRIVS